MSVTQSGCNIMIVLAEADKVRGNKGAIPSQNQSYLRFTIALLFGIPASAYVKNIKLMAFKCFTQFL